MDFVSVVAECVVPEDVLAWLKRQVQTSSPGRFVSGQVNPEQLHKRLLLLLGEAEAEVLSALSTVDVANWKEVLRHPENRQQLIRWGMEDVGEVRIEVKEWTLENAPDPEKVRGLLEELFRTVQRLKMKHFAPEFFNLKSGQDEIMKTMKDGFAGIEGRMERVEVKVTKPLGPVTSSFTDADVAEVGPHVIARDLLVQDKMRTARVLLETLKAKIESPGDKTSEQVRAKIYNNLGVCLEYANEGRTAAVLFKKAYSLEPSNIKYRMNNAMAVFLEGDGNRALSLIDDVLAACPDDPLVLFAKTRIMHDLGHDQEASALLDVAVKKFPSDEQLWYLRSMVQMELGLWDDAVSSAKEAMEMGKQSWRSQLMTADAISGRARYQIEVGLRTAFPLSEETRREFETSVSLYDVVLGKLDSNEVPQQVVGCLVKRASARVALGEIGEALEDIEEALKISPKDPEARLDRAMLMLDDAPEKELDEDLRVALAGCQEKRSVVFWYATFKLKRRGAEDCLTFLGEHADIVKGDALLQRLEATSRDLIEGGHKHEIEFFEGILRNNPQDAVTRAEYATVLGDSGKDVQAELEFSRSMKDANEALRPAVEVMYAVRLFRLGDHKGAIERFEKNVPLNCLSSSLTQYIDCLLKAGEYPRCLDLMKKLSKELQGDRRISDLLAQLEERQFNFKEALDLWSGLSSEHREDARFFVHKVWCMWRLGKKETLGILDGGFQVVKNARADERMMIAWVLSSYGRKRDGLRQAYRAVISSQPDQKYWMPYVGLFFETEKAGNHGFDRECVSGDCVVTVKIGDDSHCFYLPGDHDGLPHPPESSEVGDVRLKEALMGKKVGDEFSFTALPIGRDVTGTVVALTCAEVKLLQYILGKPELHAPSMDALRKIDVTHGFDEVMKAVDDQSKRGELAVELYRDRAFPLSFVAKVLGKGLVEVFSATRESLDLVVDAFPGNAGELPAEVARLTQTKEIVVDLPALLLLSEVSQLELVAALGKVLIAAQSTMDVVQMELESAKGNAKGYSVLTTRGLREVPKEKVEELISSLGRIRDLLADERVCSLTGRPTDNSPISELQNCLTIETFDTMNLALKTNKLAMIGDRRVMSLMKGVPVISVRAVVEAAHRDRILTDSDFVGVIARFASSNVTFVSVDSPLLLLAFEKWRNHGGYGDLDALIETLSDQKTNLRDAVRVASDFVATLLIEGGGRLYGPEAVRSVLKALCRRPGSVVILTEFYRQTTGRLAMYPKQSSELEQVVGDWLERRPMYR